ncbi:SsgA family sporulation/cell division regulator [Streptomyces mirabilis]
MPRTEDGRYEESRWPSARHTHPSEVTTRAQASHAHRSSSAPSHHAAPPRAAGPQRSACRAARPGTALHPPDPFGIRVLLRTDGASVQWSLARETLLLGLRRPEGIGDVAVWPVREPGSPGWLRIRLGPLRACAVVQTERDVISDWLDVTLRLVPQDTESNRLQWDGFLASLLDQEGP